MAKFIELFSYRDKIMEALVSDSLLMKAVVGDDTTIPITSQPSIEFPEDYLYKNIFPYKKGFDGTIETAQSMITTDLSFSGKDGNYFKDASLIFFVFVHEDLALLVNSDAKRVLRTDYIAHRIDTLFNQQRTIGIGKLGFKGLRSVDNVPAGFFAIALVYTTVEFS